MPTACRHEEAHDDTHVHVHGSPLWEQLAAHVGQYLTDEGRRRMHEDLGAALVASMTSSSDLEVNRVVEAWLRTLRLKQAGVDGDLDQPDPVEEPLSLDEWRRKLAV